MMPTRGACSRELYRIAGVVRAVANVPDALDSIVEFQPHILVSDLGMPRQDGFELIRLVRSRGYTLKRLPALPVPLPIAEADKKPCWPAFREISPNLLSPRDNGSHCRLSRSHGLTTVAYYVAMFDQCKIFALSVRIVLADHPREHSCKSFELPRTVPLTLAAA